MAPTRPTFPSWHGGEGSAAPCRHDRPAARAEDRSQRGRSPSAVPAVATADQDEALPRLGLPPRPLRAGPTRHSCRARALETADAAAASTLDVRAQRPNSFTSSNCVISFSTSDGTRCILKRAGATACDDSINCFKTSCSRPRPRQYTRLAGSLRYVSVTYNDTNRDRETHQCGLSRDERASRS